MSNKVNASLEILDKMEELYKFAQIVAKSDIIPSHYRGKPANVFMAVQTAFRMDMDPYQYMESTFLTHGKLGVNTSFAISRANNSGLFKNGIRYQVNGSGENLSVTAYTTLKNTDEEISYTVSMKDAKAEGWTKNPKYKTLPELMLRYRAATFLIRTHIPEVMNGMHMVEELEDITYSKQKQNSGSSGSSKVEKLNNYIDEAAAESEEEQEEESYGLIKSKEANDLMELITHHNISEETTQKWCKKAGVRNLGELYKDKILVLIDFIKDKYGPIKQNDNDLEEEEDNG